MGDGQHALYPVNTSILRKGFSGHPKIDWQSPKTGAYLLPLSVVTAEVARRFRTFAYLVVAIGLLTLRSSP